MSLEDLARKYALQNAVQHGGRANPGAVIGKIMSDSPEYRSDPKLVAQTAGKVAAAVNGLSPEEQRKELESLAPELLEKKKQERNTELADIPNVSGEVVMRFAPGPYPSGDVERRIC